VLLLLLLFVFMGSGFSLDYTQVSDKDHVFNDDTKPTDFLTGEDYFSVDRSEKPQELFDRLTKGDSYISTRTSEITAQLGVPRTATENIFGTLLYVYPSASERMDALNAYMAMVGLWSGSMASCNTDVLEAIAKISVAMMGCELPTKCTAYTYTKKTEMTSEHNVVTTNAASASNGVFKDKTSSYSNIDETLTVSTKQEYTQHCDNWQVDPEQVLTQQIRYAQALEGVYGVLKTQIAASPSIWQFVPADPADIVKMVRQTTK